MNNLWYKNVDNIITLETRKTVKSGEYDRKFLTHFVDARNQTVTKFLYA